MYKVCVLGYEAGLGLALSRSVMGVGWRVRLTRRWDEAPLALDALEGQVTLGAQAEQVVVNLDDEASVIEAMRGCNYVFYDALCGLGEGDADTQRLGVVRMRRVCRALRESNADKLVVTSSVATMALGADQERVDESGVYAPLWGQLGLRAALTLVERELWRYAADALNVCVLNPTAPLETLRWPASLGGERGVNVCSLTTLARMHINAGLYGAAGRRYIIGGVEATAGELTRALKPTDEVTPRQRLAYELGARVDLTRAKDELELVVPASLDAL